MNDIENVRLHGVALGNESGEGTLSIPNWNSGEATLTSISELEDGKEVSYSTVPIQKGDEVLQGEVPPIFIKIDVEGFELNVLKGLSETISFSKPGVFVEVIGVHLARANASVKDVFDFFRLKGYQAFNCELDHRLNRLGLLKKLVLCPATAEDHGSNVLWLHPQSECYSRLHNRLFLSTVSHINCTVDGKAFHRDLIIICTDNNRFLCVLLMARSDFDRGAFL
jgi:FkbM family methyltransferase